VGSEEEEKREEIKRKVSVAHFLSPLLLSSSLFRAMLRVGNVSAEATQPVFDGLLAMCGPVKTKKIFKDQR
jgi:hypothetical protein